MTRPYLCRDLTSSAWSGVVGIELVRAGDARARLAVRVVCARAPSLTSVRDPRVGSYREAAERLGHNRACLSIARKLLKRSYHTLRELGEEALQPA